jgi:hypothetical protein
MMASTGTPFLPSVGCSSTADGRRPSALQLEVACRCDVVQVPFLEGGVGLADRLAVPQPRELLVDHCVDEDLLADVFAGLRLHLVEGARDLERLL